ncbi:MAG: pitrilysin family protein [Candidatus Izemoplasma sp.]
MKKYSYNHINEELFHLRLTNGLNVYLLPKNDYSKTYVTFTTKFGSINLEVKDTKGNITALPSGIAHFLEHKLFERNGEDISRYFAENGASVNAFTQNSKTTYLFSATSNIYQNLDLLMDLVQKPQFSTKGIDKEKGIIAQEIKMYDDDPTTVSYMGILNNLFPSHPIKNDILGTIDTINTIDKEILEIAHNAYYSPSNMVLFLAGNFNLDKVVTHLTKNQLDYKYSAKYFPVVEETPEIMSDIIQERTIELDIVVPSFLMGIKELPKNINKDNLIKKELTFSILMDMFIGRSTKNFQSLITKGLINDTFGIDITFEDTYGFFLIGSETKVPEKLEKVLFNMFKNMRQHTFEEEKFNRSKKQIIGGFIHALNSLEFIANQFTKYYYFNQSLFDVLDILESITIKDVMNEIEFFENEDLYSTFLINPNRKEKN